MTVTIPSNKENRGIRPGYVSPNTESLVIQLSSVDGQGVSGVNATTIETSPHSRGCRRGPGSTVCSGTTYGSPGSDIFSVTTYAQTNGVGAVLSVGTVQSKIDSGGGNVPINNLSLALYGVIASLHLTLSPNDAKRGKPASSSVALTAFDGSGAQIVGPSDFSTPIVLSVQGDAQKAFRLHAPGRSGSSLSIVRPTSNLALSYDGNPQASSINVQASVDGPGSTGANAHFKLKGKQPPPPIGTIYALNLGKKAGLGATVTEYDGKAGGNAPPKRVLDLSTKLYARSLAVDSNGNIYVGFFDNQYGFSPSNGAPDPGNVVAVYAPDASGKTPPTAVLTQDPKTDTALFPIYTGFDASGDLIAYGATTVDGNAGDAVLTYAPGSKGSAAPSHAWAFATPQIRYAGPTGLALDSAGNFYVNGSLYTSLGPSDGVFVAPASDNGDPQTSPSRTIPWDSTTQLTSGITTNVALDDSGEVFVANSLFGGGSSNTSCQGRANVFAAGSTGGVTDVPPLRVLVLSGIYTKNSECASSRDPLSAFFPSIALYGTTLFAVDDFNDAILGYPASSQGTVKPTLTIAGSATELDAPVAVVVTSLSGRAKARPAYPFHALHSQ